MDRLLGEITRHEKVVPRLTSSFWGLLLTERIAPSESLLLLLKNSLVFKRVQGQPL